MTLALVFILGGLGLIALGIYFLRRMKKEEERQKKK